MEEIERLKCMRWKLEEELECHISKAKNCDVSLDIPFQLADMIKDLAAAEESISKHPEKESGGVYEKYMNTRGSEPAEKLDIIRDELFDNVEEMITGVWPDIAPANKQKYLQRVNMMLSKLQQM